ASLEIRKCSTNHSRTGFLETLTAMGADVSLSNEHNELEPFGNIHIQSADLTGINVSEHLIPNMIDELPLIALLGCHAKGKTVVRNASELRVKESDRISILCKMFTDIGISIKEHEDGFEIEGPQTIKGGITDSYNDHRMAMLAGICGVLSKEGVRIKRHECVSVSFPSFFEKLKIISR
ncbi:MAG: 3-phosphoshikimate 1-carboxyvinyltransferase, partial [Thermotogota bacterium]